MAKTSGALWGTNKVGPVPANTTPIPVPGATGPIKEIITNTYILVPTTDYFIIMMNNAARTVTLPENPAHGTTFTIKDGSGNGGTNFITLVAQGSDVIGDGNVSSYPIIGDYNGVTAVYNATTEIWWLENG